MNTLKRLAFETDGGIGTRAALGLIVLETDETIENEFRQIIGEPDIATYHSRIPMRSSVTSQTLAAMEAELPAAVRLLPASANLDVIGYGCTSGATVIGSKNVANAVHAVLPDVKVTDPIASILTACVALKVDSVAFLTPYMPEVSVRMRQKLEQAGCSIAAFGSFLEEDDRVVAKITERSILAAIASAAENSNCDAVVVSCTNLRVAGIAEAAEKIVGCPVISSNTALAWNMLRLAGVDTRRHGFGRLYQCQAA